MSFMLIAAILAFFGLMALATVALAAGLSILPLQRIRSFALTLLWIVPALAVVGLVGYRWEFDHGLKAVKRSRTHSEIQHTVESRAIPESGEATSPKPAAVRPAVLTSDSWLPAEAPDGASELAGVAKLVVTDAAEAGTRIEIETNLPPLHRLPIPPLAPVFGGASPKNSAPALVGVLKVGETQHEPPEWAGKDPVPRGDSVLVPLSSQMWATMGEAERQVTERAAAYVKEFYHDEYPIHGDWTVPMPVIEQNAVSALVGEEIDKDFGGEIGTKKMFRAHLRLDVGPDLRQALHASWHDQVVNHRLTELGGLLGLATLMLATAAGYFRLDDATAGQYRRRLKFAAAALISAGSLVVWQVVA
jgi:hypothetical protein